MELSTPYKNRPRRRWHGKNVWVNVAKESLEQQEGKLDGCVMSRMRLMDSERQ